MDDWIIKDDGEYVSYVKTGYELDYFEIQQFGSLYSVKVPLRQADCMYTTKFASMCEARNFLNYHFNLYYTTS